MRSFGVEEELLIVDPSTGAPLPLAARLLQMASGSPADGPSLHAEFKQEQIEANTRPCFTAAELLTDIQTGRALADAAAATVGARVAALATPPIFAATPTDGDARFATMSGKFGLIAREQLTCGLHVHVSIDSEEEGIAVLDRIRVWLPLILALSANSPFWAGVDAGFASYRSQIWNRWPSAGPMPIYGSVAGYRQLVDSMLSTDVLLDEGMVYFDARLSRTHPTVEIRIADVCMASEDACTLATLIRGLVEASANEWKHGRSPALIPASLLRLATWQASRFGVETNLLHPFLHRPRPAANIVVAALEHAQEPLTQSGDFDAVSAGLRRILARGSGERLQRATYADGGRLADVVAAAVARTHAVSQTHAVPQTHATAQVTDPLPFPPAVGTRSRCLTDAHHKELE